MCDNHKREGSGLTAREARRQEAREASGWMAGACLLVLGLGVAGTVLYHWAYDRGYTDGRIDLSDTVRQQFGAWRETP